MKKQLDHFHIYQTPPQITNGTKARKMNNNITSIRSC